MAPKSNQSSEKRERVEQRPWLGDAVPVSRQTNVNQQPRYKSVATEASSQTVPKTKSQPSQYVPQETAKGTPFKPTPNYQRYAPKQTSTPQARAPQAEAYQAKSFGPKDKSNQQQGFESRPKAQTEPQASISTEPIQETVAATPAIEKTVAQAPQQLAEVNPDIRREIEEQVKRDLEKKFESQIQNLVQKQVREQVKQAQRKMQLDARNARNTRVATRPLLGSTYRAPNRREPPTITGEVLPLIVPGNSKTNPEQSHARYLLTDSLSEAQYRTEFESGNRIQNSYAPQKTPVDTTRRAPQPVTERLKDGAQSKPQKVKNEFAAASIATEPQPESVPAQATNVEPLVREEAPEPANPYSLRTSVVGPEALLKDQSDGYEISIANMANHPATDVIVQLSVPEAITISRLDRDAYLDQKQRTVSWKIPKIEAGQKEVIQYRAVSATAGEYKQEVTLGMENTFQGRTPFTTVVQIGAKPLSTQATEMIEADKEDYVEVAERLEFDN